MAAFELALQNGCDGIEFDVRFSYDRRGVICHDADFAGLNIASAEAEVLATAGMKQGTPLAMLEEVLEQFGNRAYLDLDTKTPGFEPEILEALRRYPPQRGYVVSSFHPEILLKLHELGPELPLGYICKERKLLSKWQDLPIGVVIPNSSLVLSSLVEDWHEHGKQVFVWTVNNRKERERLSSWEVDAIITDQP